MFVCLGSVMVPYIYIHIHSWRGVSNPKYWFPNTRPLYREGWHCLAFNGLNNIPCRNFFNWFSNHKEQVIRILNITKPFPTATVICFEVVSKYLPHFKMFNTKIYFRLSVKISRLWKWARSRLFRERRNFKSRSRLLSKLSFSNYLFSKCKKESHILN